MTVLLWVLAVLAVPTVLFGLWLAWVFLKEFFSPGTDPDTGRETAEALGLLPAERQNVMLAGPLPPGQEPALAAVRGGDWKAAAKLMHDAGQDWERRSFTAYLLGGIAAKEDDWLLAWEADRPDDPDAALVRARSTVVLAWDLRGGKKAAYTTGEQFSGFHRMLERSREEIGRAAALNPDDPTPYVTEIWVALGLGYPHSEMDRLWTEITARAPHHYEAHFSALQYWCAKWRGSERLATEFAERAAARAPLGSLLTAFPLIAHFEHDTSDDNDVDRTPRMIGRVDAGLADAAAADPAHPRLPELRHLLAYYLALQDRDDAALEQFRLVDGYVNALPWRYRGGGEAMAAFYCRIRRGQRGRRRRTEPTGGDRVAARRRDRRNPRRRRRSVLRAGGQSPSRAREVAGVAVRVPLQVVLVLGLGLPEGADRLHLGDDLARPQSGGVHVRDGVLGDPLLLVVHVVDRRAVAEADVVALAVPGARVVDLEEELQQRAEIGLRRVEEDLDALRVRAVVAVRRVRHVPAGVTDPGRRDARELADQVLHPPEASARQHRPLRLHSHRSPSTHRQLCPSGRPVREPPAPAHLLNARGFRPIPRRARGPAPGEGRAPGRGGPLRSSRCRSRTGSGRRSPAPARTPR
jgi:hypothetical protein